MPSPPLAERVPKDHGGYRRPADLACVELAVISVDAAPFIANPLAPPPVNRLCSTADGTISPALIVLA